MAQTVKRVVKKKPAQQSTEDIGDSSFSFFSAILKSIDIRVFIARVLKKFNIFIMIFIPIVMFATAAVLGKMLIQNKWTATCTLFRDTKELIGRKDLPDIYSDIDIDTVLKSIKKRSNVIKVIKSLGLNMSVDQFYGKIDIEKHKNKKIIIISATDKDRFIATEIANTLARVFKEYYDDLQKTSAMEVFNYYKKTSQKIESEIKRLERKQKEFRESNRVISIETEIDSKFGQLNEMELKLIEHKMTKADLDIRLSDIIEQLKTMKDNLPISYIVSAGGKELAAKQRQLSVLRKKYTDKNPKVIRIINEIEEMKKDTSEKKNSDEETPEQVTYGPNIQKAELKQEQFTIKSQLKSLSSNIKGLQSKITQTNKRLEDLAKIKSFDSDIQRQIDTNLELVQKFKQIMSVAEIASKSIVSNIKILEEAVPPIYPESSMKKVLALAGGFLGFVIAVCLVLVPEILDFSVKSSKEISSLLRVKNSGMIPNKDQVQKSMFYEGLQVAIDDIVEASMELEKPNITFYSSTQGTGKSFIIDYYIELLTRKGNKILYIDSIDEVTDDIQKSLINIPLYNSDKNASDIVPNKITENLDKLYFFLDLETFKYPLGKEIINKLFDDLKVNYDYLILEMFPFKKNRQLFNSFVQCSDLEVLVSKFKFSGKYSDYTLVDFVSKGYKGEVYSLVNCVDRHYYKFLS